MSPTIVPADGCVRVTTRSLRAPSMLGSNSRSPVNCIHHVVCRMTVAKRLIVPLAANSLSSVTPGAVADHRPPGLLLVNALPNGTETVELTGISWTVLSDTQRSHPST